jgi:hypothetical protein
LNAGFKKVKMKNMEHLFLPAKTSFRPQLSNCCSMVADEPAHVRACSTASTPACNVPGLLSLLKNYSQKKKSREIGFVR